LPWKGGKKKKKKKKKIIKKKLLFFSRSAVELHLVGRTSIHFSVRAGSNQISLHIKHDFSRIDLWRTALTTPKRTHTRSTTGESTSNITHNTNTNNRRHSSALLTFSAGAAMPLTVTDDSHPNHR
jgi:uncharacterized protein involved in type VI secretion and phage assembly